MEAFEGSECVMFIHLSWSESYTSRRLAFRIDGILNVYSEPSEVYTVNYFHSNSEAKKTVSETLYKARK